MPPEDCIHLSVGVILYNAVMELICEALVRSCGGLELTCAMNQHPLDRTYLSPQNVQHIRKSADWASEAFLHHATGRVFCPVSVKTFEDV